MQRSYNQMDNNEVVTEVSHLNNNIETKDKLIASLERTIELLGHRQ